MGYINSPLIPQSVDYIFINNLTREIIIYGMAILKKQFMI